MRIQLWQLILINVDTTNVDIALIMLINVNTTNVN